MNKVKFLETTTEALNLDKEAVFALVELILEQALPNATLGYFEATINLYYLMENLTIDYRAFRNISTVITKFYRDTVSELESRGFKVDYRAKADGEPGTINLNWKD